MDDELRKLNEELNKQKDKINQTPIEDFDNLSPEDMFNILYKPFQEECPIQYKKNIENSTLNKIPFLELFEYYIHSINKLKEIKLTARGNLPTKFVKELYGQNYIEEEIIKSGIQKLYKEEDSLTIQNVKIIADLIKFTKKRNNKLSLTQNAIKFLKSKNQEEVLKLIFQAYGYKFNLGYHDGYEDQSEIQKTLGYAIYLLLKYGEEERELGYYTNKILIAYPHMRSIFNDSYSSSEEQFKSCFFVRIFERFLEWFNFVSVRKERAQNRFEDKIYVKNKILNKVLEIRNDKFKFRKGKFYA